MAEFEILNDYVTTTENFLFNFVFFFAVEIKNTF